MLLNIKFKFGSDFQKDSGIRLFETFLSVFKIKFTSAHKKNEIEWVFIEDLSDCCGEKIIKGRCSACGENA